MTGKDGMGRESTALPRSRLPEVCVWLLLFREEVFSAESESQTWHWAAGPSLLFPGFHFHFQRVGPLGLSHRSPRKVGSLQRGLASPPSAMALVQFAFPSAALWLWLVRVSMQPLGLGR